MKIRTATMILTAALLLLGAIPANGGSYYVQIHGGFTSVNLDDVNDAIERVNDAAGADVMDKIRSGGEAGLGIGFALNEELELGLGYSRLFAASEISRDGYLVTYDLPADLFEISLDFIPVSAKKVRLGAGADVGLVSSAGSIRLVDPVVGDRTHPFDGAGFLFAGYALLDGSLSGAWSWYAEGGFRHAIISELKVDGETVFNPDSVDDKLRFNYSGFFLRLGLTFRP